MECVSYGVVCGVFYCVDSENAIFSEYDNLEHELRVKLFIVVVKTRLGRFWNGFVFFDLCSPL